MFNKKPFIKLILVLSIICSFQQSFAKLQCEDIFYSFPKDLIFSAEEYLRKTGRDPIEGHGKAERWPIDGQEAGSEDSAKRTYVNALSGVLNKTGIDVSDDTFHNMLIERRSQNKSTHTLDLFGSGFFIEDQSLVDSITGIRFGPFDKRTLPKTFLGKVPVEILGDALNAKTWKNLDRSMERRSIPSMDLVTMKPEGGWDLAFSRSEDQNIHALKFIIGQVLLRLSSTGRFFFSFPVGVSTSSEVNSKSVRANRVFAAPELQKLANAIEENTPYRLVLHTHVDNYYSTITYYLDGALIPK